MVVVASVFVANHREDVLVVGHAHPWLGLYSTTLGLIGAAGAVFVVWNYIRESRRPYSISDPSEETATVVEQYQRRIVMELKGAVVWILAAILVVAWLDKIGGGEM
jgi:hypothetical protein